MLNKVLLVDDDEMMHLIGEKMIKKAEFAEEVVLLNNGQEAINFFQSNYDDVKSKEVPELILLDINMPVMDGWEFLEEFANNYASEFMFVKVVIVSSSSDRRDIKKSKSFPFVVDYIVKPLTFERLNGLMLKC